MGHMGTIRDWGVILALSVFLGLYGWLRTMGVKPYSNRLSRSLPGWFLLSSAVCIWGYFDSRSFGVPLVLITVPAAVAGAIVIYVARHRGRQPAATELPADKLK